MLIESRPHCIFSFYHNPMLSTGIRGADSHRKQAGEVQTTQRQTRLPAMESEPRVSITRLSSRAETMLQALRFFFCLLTEC